LRPEDFALARTVADMPTITVKVITSRSPGSRYRVDVDRGPAGAADRHAAADHGTRPRSPPASTCAWVARTTRCTCRGRGRGQKRRWSTRTFVVQCDRDCPRSIPDGAGDGRGVHARHCDRARMLHRRWPESALACRRRAIRWRSEPGFCVGTAGVEANLGVDDTVLPPIRTAPGGGGVRGRWSTSPPGRGPSPTE